MSPHHTISSFSSALAATGEALLIAVDGAGRALAWLDLAMQVSRERRDLAALDDRLLKDIGLDRGQVYRETTREFGDVPRNRA